jgi:hypothetical protein
MEQPLSENRPLETSILERIENISVNMTGWLKFLGIMMIIIGALNAISIIGVLWAWLPIWLGILLLQAGNRASNARIMSDPQELVVMMDKLRLYFVISGVMMIVFIAITLISILTFGSIISHLFESMPELQRF